MVIDAGRDEQGGRLVVAAIVQEALELPGVELFQLALCALVVFKHAGGALVLWRDGKHGNERDEAREGADRSRLG